MRHAHRDKPQGRSADNGLSKKGWKQAESIADFFIRRFGKTEAALLSSPKVRCLETLVPLAKKLRVEVEMSPLLMEQEGSWGELEERIRAFRTWWEKEASPLTVACSHGDWIPAALKEYVDVDTELKKGGWAELDFDGNHPRLTWLVQTLD